MFIAFFFIIINTQKPPGCPSVGEWINVAHPDNGMTITPHKRTNHEKMWRNHKCILLGERWHSEKATCYIIPTVRHSGKGRIGETKDQ
jgi:hypothetical protein